jgi:hypothetical protein
MYHPTIKPYKNCLSQPTLVRLFTKQYYLLYMCQIVNIIIYSLGEKNENEQLLRLHAGND